MINYFESVYKLIDKAEKNPILQPIVDILSPIINMIFFKTKLYKEKEMQKVQDFIDAEKYVRLNIMDLETVMKESTAFFSKPLKSAFLLLLPAIMLSFYSPYMAIPLFVLSAIHLCRYILIAIAIYSNPKNSWSAANNALLASIKELFYAPIRGIKVAVNYIVPFLEQPARDGFKTQLAMARRANLEGAGCYNIYNASEVARRESIRIMGDNRPERLIS